MKKILFAFGLSALLFSCTDTTETNTEKITKEEKNISKRNEGITPSNSYSDLFLDTTTVQNFIKQNKTNISLT